MDGSGCEDLPKDENISRTYPPPTLCGYVIAGVGLSARFCDRTALRGGSYCPNHAALCQVRPGTAKGVRLAAEQERAAEREAPPPPGCVEVALPEPLEATEPDEVMADLELPARDEVAP
jgi:hypothetical protein